MKGWFIFGAAIISLWLYSDYKKQQNAEKREAQAAACQANPTCRDEKANQKALFRSYISSSPIHSTTGAIYFKGKVCKGDCSGHIAGYKWAEERGISKDEGCTAQSQSFNEGCMQYVSDRVDELGGKSDIIEHDRDESCTRGGRYGDC